MSTVPIVVTQNAATVDGHRYADLLGEQYEYPTRYAKLMATGETVVYYRGRRGAPSGEPPYAYVGVGVVGRIDGPVDGLLTARIEDFVQFDKPVPFKIDGHYIEDVPDRGGSVTGVFFRGTSVRALSEPSYRRILRLAGLEAAQGQTASETSVGSLALGAIAEPASGSPYPSHTQAAASDDAGMNVAMQAVAGRWPLATVHRMAQTNPGFDIAVELDDGWQYVEVKSTAGTAQRFFLSEGERRFATRNADRYSLLVVTSVLASPKVHWRDGAIDGPDIDLQPRQWLGRIEPPPGDLPHT
jgi:hypothetical protein